jgi:hypothetical protein
VFQWFRLSNAVKRIAHDRLDEVEKAQRHPSFGLDPVA